MSHSDPERPVPEGPPVPESGGKVSHAHNKVGAQEPHQKNEGRRTPLSRHDRESLIGADNQVRGRRGGPGSPQGEKAR